MKQIPLLFIPFITFFDPLTFWEPSQDFFGKLVFHFWWHWNWAWQVPSQHLSPRHSRYCSTPSNAFWQPWLNHDFNSMLYIPWDISIYDVIEDSQLWHGMKICNDEKFEHLWGWIEWERKITIDVNWGLLEISLSQSSQILISWQQKSGLLTMWENSGNLRCSQFLLCRYYIRCMWQKKAQIWPRSWRLGL